MILRGLVRGVAAGAAGSTALNAVSGVDAAVRARPASTAPAELVAALADDVGVAIPGGRGERKRRLAALGPLAGIVSGVGVGAVAGALRAAGVRLPAAVGGPVLGLVAMLASDWPLAAEGISDPRTWSRQDWVADVLPHLAYGVATHQTLVGMSRYIDGTEPVAPVRLGILAKAAALGVASGARSSAGVTAVAFASRREDGGAAGLLGRTTGKAAAGLLAAGELVADKLPVTPSRLEPQGMAPRVAFGAATAGAMARRDGIDPDLPALVGTLAAVAGALVGTQWRSSAERRFGSDRPGAFIEDAAAALLGWLGARR